MRVHHHVVAFAMIAALALIASCDPVHNDAINALGGEAADVRTGPLHRPGQPCLLCHDGTFGNPPQFTVAGTIYENAAPEQAKPVVGAEVTMTNVDGSSHQTQTNEAGNFYVLPSEWTPGFPYKVTVKSGASTACMMSLVGRDGSCAGCHVEPAGKASPGRVTLFNDLPNGGCPK